jgi:hypothetical protein
MKSPGIQLCELVKMADDSGIIFVTVIRMWYGNESKSPHLCTGYELVYVSSANSEDRYYVIFHILLSIAPLLSKYSRQYFVLEYPHQVRHLYEETSKII